MAPGARTLNAELLQTKTHWMKEKPPDGAGNGVAESGAAVSGAAASSSSVHSSSVSHSSPSSSLRFLCSKARLYFGSFVVELAGFDFSDHGLQRSAHVGHAWGHFDELLQPLHAWVIRSEHTCSDL